LYNIGSMPEESLWCRTESCISSLPGRYSMAFEKAPVLFIYHD
jgi:hypothetical protein